MGKLSLIVVAVLSGAAAVRAQEAPKTIKCEDLASCATPAVLNAGDGLVAGARGAGTGVRDAAVAVGEAGRASGIGVKKFVTDKKHPCTDVETCATPAVLHTIKGAEIGGRAVGTAGKDAGIALGKAGRGTGIGVKKFVTDKKHPCTDAETCATPAVLHTIKGAEIGGKAVGTAGKDTGIALGKAGRATGGAFKRFFTQHKGTRLVAVMNVDVDGETVAVFVHQDQKGNRDLAYGDSGGFVAITAEDVKTQEGGIAGFEAELAGNSPKGAAELKAIIASKRDAAKQEIAATESSEDEPGQQGRITAQLQGLADGKIAGF